MVGETSRVNLSRVTQFPSALLASLLLLWRCHFYHPPDVNVSLRSRRSSTRSMVTLNPDDCIPLGVHEGYKKLLTELFCGGLGVDKLDREALGRFKTLEVMWLNDNKLSKLKGLEDNFRLKHLYLHNNRIASLVNSSCCLKELRHLETLQLQGNMLQDLQATLKVLQKLTSLRQLNMQGNPLTNEQSYRAWVVYSLPWLDILDNFRVTQFEKVHPR